MLFGEAATLLEYLVDITNIKGNDILLAHTVGNLRTTKESDYENETSKTLKQDIFYAASGRASTSMWRRDEHFRPRAC